MVLSCINYAKRSFKIERLRFFLPELCMCIRQIITILLWPVKKKNLIILLCIPEAGVTLSFGTAPNNGCIVYPIPTPFVIEEK